MAAWDVDVTRADRHATIQGRRGEHRVQTEDAELVARARVGDREAFAEIFDRYGDRIHDFCASFLRDPHDGADATQDAFLLAAQRLEQLRDPSALRPWLYAIARSACLRRIRSQRRTEPSEEVVEVAVHDDADDQVRRGELRALLADAAAGLSDRDRELLDLRLRHDLSTGEVAEVLEVTSDHASVLLGRMRERVERSLGALLVARQGADDCPELAGLLAGWDGRFDPRLRKRVARHVDGCPSCAEHRSRALAPSAMLSIAPLLAAPAGLREQIVRSAALPGSPGARGPAGPPGPGPGAAPPGLSGGRGRGMRRVGVPAVVGAVLLLGGAAGTALGLFGGTDEPASVTLVPVPPASSPTSSPTPTAGAASTASPTPTPGPTEERSPSPPPAPVLSVDPGTLAVPAGASVGHLRLTVRHAATTVRISPMGPWAVAAPAVVEVAPGETVEVTVRVDRTELDEGTHGDTLVVSGDEADVVSVPVEVAVERPPLVTEVEGTAHAETGPDDGCTGTLLDVVAPVSDESPLDDVALVATVDGESRRVTMSPDEGRWYGMLRVPAGTDTVEWVVEAADVRGNTARSTPQVTQTLC